MKSCSEETSHYTHFFPHLMKTHLQSHGTFANGADKSACAAIGLKLYKASVQQAPLSVQRKWSICLCVCFRLLLLSITPSSSQAQMQAQTQVQTQTSTQPQTQVLSTSSELSVNGFRNPSIGLEYRHSIVSVHLGYYLTNFAPDVTTTFIRAGLTLWYLPLATDGDASSSLYTSVSYLYGLSRDWTGDSGFMVEAGFRWMPWRGLNLRLGVNVLASAKHELKVNPNPGISWSFVW